MSRLRIEKGASKVRRAPLKATIDGTVSDDLELMCAWSENDLSYLVNILLGFAIAQSEEFQKYKAEKAIAPQSASVPARKVLPSANAGSPQVEKGASA